MIGDETDSISEAVIEVRANLRSVEEEFQCIWLGNDPSLLNPLGKLMEPEPNTPVQLKDIEWTSTTGIHCLRFDGFDSPNITESPKDKYTGIIREETIDAIIRDAHSDNAPIVWIMVRGLHPPEGSDDTVLSEAAIHRFNCRDKVIWKSGFTRFASLDPSRGGDACCFRTFKRGEIVTRDEQEGIPASFAPFKTVIQIECDEVINFPIAADDKSTPPNYQIAYRVISECKKRNIPPDEFILSVTGLGSGVRDVLMREWSPRINELDEAGACSTTIVSNENPRPAKELYDRKVTELWMVIREFAEANMLRGLDHITARQLCSRKIEVKGTGQGKRLSIEKKEDMLASPDEADALAFALQHCRDKDIFPTVQSPLKAQAQTEFEKKTDDYNFDASQDAYSDPLLDSALEQFADLDA
jgi:hypothetical protein